MYWCTALLFNFLSSLMAILGFFTGVAVSTSSHVAKEWLLAIAAGSFLYIALADLVSIRLCSFCTIIVSEILNETFLMNLTFFLLKLLWTHCMIREIFYGNDLIYLLC